MKRRPTPEQLAKLRDHFHALIWHRAKEVAKKKNIDFPDLTDIEEDPEHEWWLPIPGMYGGFKYSLHYDGEEPFIITESWCRVVGGSGQRHKITTSAVILEEEGFV
jgi:hypothetical protein